MNSPSNHTLNATDALATPAQLPFVSSSHKQLGVKHDNVLESARENMPALVGAMRLFAALLPVASGLLGWEDEALLEEALPLFTLHGAGLIASEGILMAYGNRESRMEAAQENAGKPELSDWAKPFNPKRYPLESSAALDVAGELAMLLGGIAAIAGIMTTGAAEFLGLHGYEEAAATSYEEAYEECMEKTTSFSKDRTCTNAAIIAEGTGELHYPGDNHNHASDSGEQPHKHDHSPWAFVAHGAAGLAAHLPILFGKERPHIHGIFGHDLHQENTPNANKDSLTFGQSTSKIVGAKTPLLEQLKDQPVLTASVMQFAVGISFIALNPASWSLMASGAIIAASAVLQGLFVRKNIENELPSTQVREPQLDELLNKQSEIVSRV